MDDDNETIERLIRKWGSIKAIYAHRAQQREHVAILQAHWLTVEEICERWVKEHGQDKP